MSYEIIFKTVIVEKENKIYHFSRSGCNNDDQGRKDDEFILKVYENKESALNDILWFKGCTEYELKLNSKFVNYDYYYNYLKKKIEKPLSYDQFNKNYYTCFQKLENILCINNNTYYDNFNNEIYYNLLKEFKNIRLLYNYKDVNFNELDNNFTGRIYIKKIKIYNN